MVKRPVVLLTALMLLTVSCTGDGAPTSTSQTQPTTAPSETTTTQRAQLVDGGLTPMDPNTLVPLEGAEPVVVAEDHWGVISPNRRWAAISSWHSGAEERTEITVVDLDDYSVLSRYQPGQAFTGLTVANDGTAYWLAGEPFLGLFALPPGSDAELLFDSFPNHLSPWEGHIETLGEDIYGVVANSPHEGEEPGPVSVVVIDAVTGAAEEIPLPEVEQGLVGEIESGDGSPVSGMARPKAVWDPANDRVLVVEATRDAVTEVDITTGEVEIHPWSLPESALDTLLAWLMPPARAKSEDVGTRRDAVLSTDGRQLFVATSVGSVEGEAIRRQPLDLIVVDTATWSVTSVLDAEVDTLHLSPDGRHLLAQGQRVTETESEYTTTASPVFVIDTETPELLIAFGGSDEQRTGVDFSPGGDLAYLTTHLEDRTKIDVIELELLQPVGSIAFRELSLVGEAGLIAFHLR